MGKTITEKIFAAHQRDVPSDNNVVLDIDVVMCHEITTPIAVNDLKARGMDRVFDPKKIKVVIDHVTPSKDTKTATQAKILRDWARRNNIKDFFDIGANGVCHALFPEKGFIRPGYTVIMGDSHTCTHGAFGAFAAGVGTTDLEVGILKGVCSFRLPETMKITITGKLAKGVYAKDVILQDHQGADRKRGHRQGDGVLRSGGGRHEHGGPHDPVQYGHRGRRHLRGVPA